MHDKFEREVQRKMEELQLSPSAPVWEKIELEITPEKKRRRPVLWFFLGVILLATGLFVFQPWQKQADKMAAQQMPAEEKRLERDPSSKEQPTSNFSTDTTTDIITYKSIEKLAGQPKSVSQHKSVRNHVKSYQKQATKNVFVWEEKEGALIQKTTNDRTTETVENSSVLNPKEKFTETNPSRKEKNSFTEQTIVDNDSTVTRIATSQKDSIAKPNLEKTEAVPPVVDSVIKKKIAANSIWQKRIHFSVGRTGYTSIASAKSAAFDQLNQSPVSAPQLGNAINRPAETKAGLGFSLGISLAKQLNKHLELAIGAQYAYYSTNTPVGTQRRSDTTIVFNSDRVSTGRYYTNTSAATYTNHFHVIELPVMLSYKPSSRLPVYVSIGAAYGRLLSTNALTYSPNANVYYEDKDNYVQNSLPLFSSVQVGLFEKKKVSVRIGPAVQYNLLKLQKGNSSGASHLFFAGIKGGINF